MERRGEMPQRGIMKLFFVMLWKARLPYLWIICYMAAAMVLANVGISVTEYTAELFAGNVSFSGVVVPFLIFTLASMGIAGVSGLLSGFCKARINRNLRLALWRKIVRLPYSIYQENRPKELLSRITTDVTAVSQLIMQVFVEIFMTGYGTFLVFRQIYSYDRELMLALLAMLPLEILISVLAGRLQFGLRDEVNRKQAELTGSVAERTGQTMLIKSFGTEEKEEKAVGSRMRGYYRAYIRNSWVTNLLSPTYAVAGAMQFIILVLVGRRFYGDGSLSLAQWVAYFAFANQIINSLTAYGGYWTTFRATQGSAFRITRVMNEKEEDLSTGDSVECLSGDIVFHDLVFGFGEEPLFDHLNLTIPAGKATAVIGPSGSGKTTLLNLLDRLYEPEGGRITIGDQEISHFSRKAYRSALTYITQEASMCSGSIRDNLVFGREEAVSDEQMEEACKLAGLWEFVESLPAGLDTPVGEEGGKLSGGQRQKLAVARGLLHPSGYLLMDEGTAAMDAVARKDVWDSLGRLMRGKTTLYVAHDR